MHQFEIYSETKQHCTMSVVACMNSLLDSERNQMHSNQTSRGGEGRTAASETGSQIPQDAPVASEEAGALDNSGSCSADDKTNAAAGQGKAQEFDFNDFFKDSVLKLIVSPILIEF